MLITHVAAELAPIAKVGGLGDVIYGLSKELVREGHLVNIILPKYDTLPSALLNNLHVEIPELTTSLGKCKIWAAKVENLSLTLIDPIEKNYFSRGKIYGCSDDTERFLFLCASAVAYLASSKKKVDALHLHDWHTALIAALKKEKKELDSIKTVLTLHNIEYQGECDPKLLAKMGLKKEEPNLLKIGIIYADALTTVSPTYEKEIQTPIAGWELDQLLQKNRGKLKGILNGIDPEFWNPETDSYLFKQYAIDSPIETILKEKKANRNQLPLERSDKPLVACITRLVPQKGPELIKHALLRTLEKGGQFILLGGAGSKEIVQKFTELKQQFAKNKNLSIALTQDEPLAHRIFAAADLLIIPSLFEPCGLTQLIAMRYGTIPIARKTGGLADTVFDIDTSDQPLEKRNGFTFDFADNEGVNWALDRAFSYYKQDKNKWHTLIQNGLSHNFTWKKSVHEYLNLYQKTN